MTCNISYLERILKYLFSLILVKWDTTLMLEESCICCFQNCAVILFWLHQSCTVKILHYWTYKEPLQADIKTCVWNSVGNNSINRVKVKSLNRVYLAELIWFIKSKIKIRKKNPTFFFFSFLSLSFFLLESIKNYWHICS